MSAEIDRGSYPQDVARLFARLVPGLIADAFVAALALAPAAVLAGEPPADPGVPGAWLSQVQQEIAREEYQVTWQTGTALPDLDAAWQAPNRSHGLRTYFTAAGIRVVPRQDAAPSWEWGLAWAGYGRGGVSWPVPAARLAPAGARVDYQRGALAEWYENSPRGLKQGFVLDAPPEQWSRSVEGEPEQLGSVAPGRGRRLATERLVHVDLALSGSLRPVVSEDGLAIDFEAPGGARVVHYAELAVTDARGEPLAAWMEGYAGAGGGGIRIVIDDADAVYPITVDPLATSPAWTAESDQASASFGVSVATAGDVNGDGYADVIVGALYYDNGQTNEGRAYVYLGSSAGLATTAAWTAESDQTDARFGNPVATAGDVNGDGYADVIVGAQNYDSGQTNEGRAYVYLGSAAGLAATAAWTAESNQDYAYFAASVATAGDVNGDGYADVIVGAILYDNGQTDEGRAYVYLGSAAGLSATAAWTAESDQAAARFGTSVATAGDVNGDGYADVIVGADYFDHGEADEGRAYVYLGSVAGLAATAAWMAESDQAAARFGISVATAGDVNGDGYADVIVGGYAFDDGQTDEGRAFVFLGSAAGLGATAAWTAESDQAYAYFGVSVAPAGDVNGDGYADVMVGAYMFDNGQAEEGRAFVYLGSAAGLGATAAWTAESDQASAYFGVSVAPAGDVNGDGYADVIVGAYYYDNGQTDEGRAYVYLGSAAGPAAAAAWTAEGDQAYAEFGWQVATAGDVNGDGYADVIVGAPSYDNGETGEGRAYVFLGSAAGLAATAAWMAEGDQINAGFGLSVATAGDVNGDGYADVIVGAEMYSNGQMNEGRAFVFLGSAAGLAATAAWTAESNQAGALLGRSVGTAGDVNGDGYADVIVGAYWYDNGQTDEGRAYVFLGSASGLAATAAWTAECDQAYGAFGYSVATAGDVNGDGYADVIVGAQGYDNGQTSEGRAYVYLGSAAGLGATAAWTAESNQVDANFGYSVATAGDVNGDGYADVIVSAIAFDNGQADEGRAFVFLGSAAGLGTTAAWTAESDQGGTSFGVSVAPAGDVNGDGYADVIVGAYFYDNGQTDEGRAYVYLGSAAGLATTAAWTAESDQAGAHLGNSVATAGDINGDGYADVIVGANRYENGQTREGRAHIYYGNAGPGLSLRPQQRRTDDSAPIAHLGISDDSEGFRLKLAGRTPFGGGRVRFSWEVKPLGVSFDSTGIQVGPLTAAGSELNALVTGLESGMPYHWRSRVVYDAASVPFASRGRWVTIPHNGWNEADLRIPVCTDLDGDRAGAGVCPRGPDCDDARASVYPGAPQACDGFNNDCNDPSWPTVPANESDSDHDGWRICAGDCNDYVWSIYPGAPEANDGADNQCAGDAGYGLIDEISGTSGFTNPGDRNAFCWTAQSGATEYLVVRSPDPGFLGGCAWHVVTGGTCWSDPESPPAGDAFYYLVRANAPYQGSWGSDASGVERSVACLVESACTDGIDNDFDLRTDCQDPDCALAPDCTHTFTFVDTPGTDIAPTALYDFFAGFVADPSAHILFRIDQPNRGRMNAWCSERADFYRDGYLAYAMSGAFLYTGAWAIWWNDVAPQAPWSPSYGGGYPNGFGPACAGRMFAWCSMSGLGGLPSRVVDPLAAGTCQIYDVSAGGCGNGTWSLTIRVAPTREAACGF